MSGQEDVLREKKTSLYQGKALVLHQAAVKKLLRILPHKNFIPLHGYNPETHETLSPHYEDLHNLFLPEGEKSAVSPRETLSILRDCLNGALFLEDHGLVLQDIKLENLGYVTQDSRGRLIQGGKKVGVLFDLEGIYPIGADLHDRYFTWLYVPPELHIKPIPSVQSSEMVYQFGVCLFEIFIQIQASLSVPVYEALAALYQDMLYYDPTNPHPRQGRIGLAEAIARLDLAMKKMRIDQAKSAATNP